VQRVCESFSGNNLEHGKLQEEQWLKNAFELLKTDLESNQTMTRASFHASHQTQETAQPVITALLPLFTEKADIPAMIKLAMDILMQTTSFSIPNQCQLWRVIAPYLTKLNLSSGHGHQLMERTNSLSCLEVCTWKWECGTCEETN